jgi:hypothetical protein
MYKTQHICRIAPTYSGRIHFLQISSMDPSRKTEVGFGQPALRLLRKREVRLLCSKMISRPGVVDDSLLDSNVMLTLGRKQVLHKVYSDLSRRSLVLAIEIRKL